MDLSTIRQIDLQRVATWMLLQLTAQLDLLRDELVNSLVTISPTGVDSYGAQQNRLAKLIARTEEQITKVYQELTSRMEGYFQDLADIEEEDQRKRMLAIFGLDIGRSKIDADAMLILGATLAGWFDQQAGNLQFRISRTLADGVLNGDTLDKLLDRIKGTKDTGFHDGPLEASKTEGEMVLRTAADTIPNEVSEAIAENNPEPEPAEPTQSATVIRYGWQQISVLDNRTTQICRAYAWKIWNMHFEPVGHKLPYDGGPPRHANCRSHIVMILLDDPVKETTFKDWLNQKPQAAQDKIFGKKKMDMWRRGVITDTDLIRQRDRQLTLDEFRARVTGQ